MDKVYETITREKFVHFSTIDTSRSKTRRLAIGQADSLEFKETLEITEIMENFTKVTKYLHKQTKRNINKLCLGNFSCHKTVRIKCSMDSRFSNELYSKTISYHCINYTTCRRGKYN